MRLVNPRSWHRNLGFGPFCAVTSGSGRHRHAPFRPRTKGGFTWRQASDLGSNGTVAFGHLIPTGACMDCVGIDGVERLWSQFRPLRPLRPQRRILAAAITLSVARLLLTVVTGLDVMVE